MELDTKRRTDRRLDLVYRVGAGLTGLFLIGFGIAGLLIRLPLFDTQGQVIAGLSTNGALSFLSIAIGSLLVGAMVLGGTFASNVCVAVGVSFVGSGLVNLYLMSTDFNILAFSMPNVIFSFGVGLVVMTFGMYGRFSGGLAEDNPYRRHREAKHEDGVPAPRTETAGTTSPSVEGRGSDGLPDDVVHRAGQEAGRRGSDGGASAYEPHDRHGSDRPAKGPRA
ncbi:DUF4383 domain-containing protein [Nocardiopsis sp. MG754419]|uniref:DUF4383 domain-containing protein n=1 Tax=Nocardiopsis sp. MG754419 TaxID=2259865 RepID=UPI001BA954B0|nr:DUF4383 domain-containing protein [Nocardiopsis sp. MG754419]MBR8744940.1 DUF4383 domain-containing protein [Nocardiopsis sp. MG754419]